MPAVRRPAAARGPGRPPAGPGARDPDPRGLPRGVRTPQHQRRPRPPRPWAGHGDGRHHGRRPLDPRGVAARSSSPRSRLLPARHVRALPPRGVVAPGAAPAASRGGAVPRLRRGDPRGAAGVVRGRRPRRADPGRARAARLLRRRAGGLLDADERGDDPRPAPRPLGGARGGGFVGQLVALADPRPGRHRRRRAAVQLRPPAPRAIHHDRLDGRLRPGFDHPRGPAARATARRSPTSTSGAV